MANCSVLFEFDPLVLALSLPSSPTSTEGRRSPQIDDDALNPAQDPQGMTAFFDKMARTQYPQDTDGDVKESTKRLGPLVDLLDVSVWDEGPSLHLSYPEDLAVPPVTPKKDLVGDFSSPYTSIAETPKPPPRPISQPATESRISHDLTTLEPSHDIQASPTLPAPPQLTATKETPKSLIPAFSVSSPSPKNLPIRKPPTSVPRPTLPSPETAHESSSAGSSHLNPCSAKRVSSAHTRFRMVSDGSRRVSLDLDTTMDMRFAESSFDLLNGEISFLATMDEMDESDSSIVIPSLESKLIGCVHFITKIMNTERALPDTLIGLSPLYQTWRLKHRDRRRGNAYSYSQFVPMLISSTAL